MKVARKTKIIGVSVPPSFAKKFEQVAKDERRTKSELFREMFRMYDSYRKQRDIEFDAWVMDIIQEAQEEDKRSPMSKEEFVRESKRLARYGEKQAKKMGIKLEDVDNIIHEQRAKRRRNRA